MKNISRRSFLRSTGAVAAGVIVIPNFVSCSANSRVNLAIVGVGGRGAHNWPQFLDKDNKKLSANIVAMCDVNDVAAAESYRAMPDVKKYRDFRRMFDEMHKDIDAVIISTPDHTHFAIAMIAMQLGKHVYVEKPMAHNIWQLRTLAKAAKHYNVIAQLGNQGHASNGIRNVKEWVDSGILGDVKEVIAWFNGPDFNPKGYFLKPDHYPPIAQDVPEGLDWDLWLGPAKERAYSPYYLPRFWRSWYDLGNAELGDWACHTLDAPFWALDLGTPNVVESEFSVRSQMPEAFITDQSLLRFEFPARGNKPPVTMKWYEGGLVPENRPEWMLREIRGSGMIMVGEKMSVLTGGRPNDARLIMPNEEWDAFKTNGWEQTIPRIPEESPHKEFLAAIRGDGPMPGSDFAYGAGLTEMALVGVLAQRFNTRIEFDTDRMEVSNHPELNAYVKEEVRPGWSYGEDLW